VTDGREIRLLQTERRATRARLRKVVQDGAAIAAKALNEALAETLHARISLYQATTWRDVPAGPTDETDALSRRVLIITGGAVPPLAFLKLLLAGVAEKTGGNGHDDHREQD